MTGKTHAVLNVPCSECFERLLKEVSENPSLPGNFCYCSAQRCLVICDTREGRITAFQLYTPLNRQQAASIIAQGFCDAAARAAGENSHTTH